MSTAIVAKADIAYLDDLLLDANGKMKLLPSDLYYALNFQHLRLWLHYKAQYGIPTKELIDWLNLILGENKNNTIEIGAGNGFLGTLLQIPMTDSRYQETPEAQLLYRLHGNQPTIKYPPEIEKLTAIEAIEKYKPHTVVAMWVTEKFNGTDGFYAGVEWTSIIKKVKRTILIGADHIHGKHTVMNLPHHTMKHSWLFSRAENRKSDSIWIWDN